jgi:hypothetical protein
MIAAGRRAPPRTVFFHYFRALGRDTQEAFHELAAFHWPGGDARRSINTNSVHAFECGAALQALGKT